YAAPEQVRGEGIGLHTDVYGLGVLAYELLTSKPPLDLSKDTPLESEQAILFREAARASSVALAAAADGAPADASTIGRAAWADLDVLCQVALHKEAARRYQSADAFIRDIDHFVKGEPLEARPDTLAYRSAKFVTRNRGRLLAGAAAVLMLIG